MSHTVCLDGVNLILDVDEVDVDLTLPGLKECAQEGATPWVRCESGEAMEPVACYEDGTTIFFHCPPEGEPDGRGYRLESSHPHHWNVAFKEGVSEGHKVKIARIQAELD